MAGRWWGCLYRVASCDLKVPLLTSTYEVILSLLSNEQSTAQYMSMARRAAVCRAC